MKTVIVLILATFALATSACNKSNAMDDPHYRETYLKIMNEYDKKVAELEAKTKADISGLETTRNNALREEDKAYREHIADMVNKSIIHPEPPPATQGQ